tara:strand:+ start:1521 stop:1751 length:231 start_codon:yes stop_codon:yes gene_type:complete
MLITNKDTGSSFNLSPKEAADFFYAKNAKGKFINQSQDYIIQDPKREVSTLQFFLCCFGLLSLCLGSFLLFLHLNY